MSKRPTPKVRREFNTWFEGHDWWHDNTARERLMPIYFNLAETMDVVDVEWALDTVMSVMKNEYGE